MKQGKSLTYRTVAAAATLPQTKSNPKCKCNWPIKIQNQMMTYIDLLGFGWHMFLSLHILCNIYNQDLSWTSSIDMSIFGKNVVNIYHEKI